MVLAGEADREKTCLPKGDEEVHPGAGGPAKAEIRQEDLHDGSHGDEFVGL